MLSVDGDFEKVSAARAQCGLQTSVHRGTLCGLCSPKEGKPIKASEKPNHLHSIVYPCALNSSFCMQTVNEITAG